MTPYRGPILSLTKIKGYWYQQMCHTNVAIASTMSVYAAQTPRFIATYLKGAPNPGVGSLQVNPNKTLKCKTRQANKESNLK